jgi:hypothetical protein
MYNTQENLEMICESFKDIALKMGDRNDISKSIQVDTTDLRRRIDYYANNIPDLPKEIKDKSVLKMVAESYHFSADVTNELKRIYG